jgi:hypothetical protein
MLSAIWERQKEEDGALGETCQTQQNLILAQSPPSPNTK